jgi:hypothetical protein
MLSYLAGLFDGEGCVHFRFSSKNQRWVCYLSISNTDRRALEAARDYFGGEIYGSPKKGSNYIVWQWNITGAGSELAARKLIRRSIIKREQLQVYLEARATYANGSRLSEKTWKTRKACAKKIQLLRY